MTFNLKNIKTANSRNGFSLSATFLINGVEVADFEDKGDGGEPTFYINMNNDAMNLYTQFEAGIESLPEVYHSGYDMNLKIDKGLFIDLLHAAIINKSEFKLLAA